MLKQTDSAASYLSEMPETPSWTSTLLSFSTSFAKANEIEGDLIEQSRLQGKSWFVFQVGLTALLLFIYTFKKAPFAALILSMASLTAASAITTFLLFPLVFQFGAFSLLTMLFVVCLFRSVACFVVGAVLVEYASILGVRTIIGTVLLMLLILLSGLFLQSWGAFGDVFLGTVFLEPTFLAESLPLTLYTLFSVLSITLGGIYSHRSKQKGLALLGCVRITPLSQNC